LLTLDNFYDQLRLRNGERGWVAAVLLANLEEVAAHHPTPTVLGAVEGMQRAVARAAPPGAAVGYLTLAVVGVFLPGTGEADAATFAEAARALAGTRRPVELHLAVGVERLCGVETNPLATLAAAVEDAEADQWRYPVSWRRPLRLHDRCGQLECRAHDRHLPPDARVGDHRAASVAHVLDAANAPDEVPAALHRLGRDAFDTAAAGCRYLGMDARVLDEVRRYPVGERVWERYAALVDRFREALVRKANTSPSDFAPTLADASS
jgi:hypothetical protein